MAFTVGKGSSHHSRLFQSQARKERRTSLLGVALPTRSYRAITLSAPNAMRTAHAIPRTSIPPISWKFISTTITDSTANAPPRVVMLLALQGGVALVLRIPLIALVHASRTAITVFPASARRR